jgi:NAD(P)-dependent dehydrogenase (short-subunit alcohol dehydrogenase family)
LIPLEGDITNRESLCSIVEQIEARHGYINLLVNNAGIAKNLYKHPLPSPTNSPSMVNGSRLHAHAHADSSHGRHPDPNSVSEPTYPSIKSFQSALWECGDPDGFADTFSTNVTAVYYTTVAFLDLLHQGNVRQYRHQSTYSQSANGYPPSSAPASSSLPPPPVHSSQVLSISSSGAFRVDPLILSMSYTLSKAACTHLGKTMANLLAPWGIRSNVLAPGVWPSGE